MENRELFTVIAVAAVVLVAVLSAGYIMVTSLMGGPTPTLAPTSQPCLTPTPHATIPSGPAISSGPTSTTFPTAVQPVIKSAELSGWGTDKDTYNRGDTAITYIIIKNTGTATVNEARLDIKVERYVPIVGYVQIQSPSTTLTDLDVKPGETKKAEYAISIPSDYEGLPTAGKYRFTIDVYVWDAKIGNFEKEVEVK